MTSSATPEFGSRAAARYDELRPFDQGLETLLGRLDRAAGLRGRRRRRGAGVRFEVAAAEGLPFEDGSFERVLMRSVAHLDDPLSGTDYAKGPGHAERVLPADVRSTYHSLVVVADAD